MKGKKLLLSAIATILLLIVITIVGFQLSSSQKNNEVTLAEITKTSDDLENSKDTMDTTETKTIDTSTTANTDIKLLEDTAFSLENVPSISDTVQNFDTESNMVSNANSETNNTNTSLENNDTQKTSLLFSNITYGRISDMDAESATLAISVADPYVNIRAEASIDSEILGKLYKGAAAAILETKDDWVLIKSGNVKGYINTEFLNNELTKDEIMEQYGIIRIAVNTDGLNVREKMDTESDRLTVIYSDEIYPVLDVTDEWVKIKVEDDNITGYVSREFVKLMVNYNQAISIEEEQALLRLKKEANAQNTDSKETLVVQKNSRVNYTTDELKLLSCLVHAESGNQPYEGKLAVANVVLNRVKSSKFPNTIKGVIYESGQFSVVPSGSLDKQLNNFNKYTTVSQKLSIDAARAALEGTNNIGNCLFFNRYSSKKESSLSYSVRIEGHLFWR